MTVALNESLKLKSGYYMPILGLGTWELTGKKCEIIVRRAIDEGYRHIDTAEVYGNEYEIGKAIRGFDRDSLFITTKVATHLAKNDVIKACKKSLIRLKTDYLDLYLVHWPIEKIPLEETIEAMNMLVENGLVRSIGLSNYSIKETKKAFSISKAPISNLQIEYHPFNNQEIFNKFSMQEGITITAYSPLARGRISENLTIKKIAEKYEKTMAQVVLRWLVQKGCIVIPKASSEKHLQENMQIFDWQLSQEDSEEIDNIKTGASYQ